MIYCFFITGAVQEMCESCNLFRKLYNIFHSKDIHFYSKNKL